jgi:hypothetical protein
MSFSELARTTFVEACVGETLGAIDARERAAAASPALRAVLLRIADDEERHAELAWATLAWAVRMGGEEARHALESTLAELRPATMLDAYEGVVRPCAERLLDTR